MTIRLAIMLSVLAWTTEALAQNYERRLGPSVLYASIESKTSDGAAIPLVIQDALQSISGNQRVLAIEPRVVGGTPAPIGAYPWQVSVGIVGSPHLRSHFCGGSIISSQWVITAAHCIYGDTAPSNIDVLAKTNLLSTGGELRSIDKIVIHEKWNSDTFEYDVALLHLSAPLATKPIEMVTAADADQFVAPGLIAIVTGWGLTKETGAGPSNALRNVTVELVSKRDCMSAAAYGGAIHDTMICAGFAEGGKDSCQGDSGGPLMVPDKKGSFLLAGIVSWGEGCGRPSKYGIYTSAPAIENWVSTTIATH